MPIEAARTMPVRVQELLGYKPHGPIGVVDVGSPMALFSSPNRAGDDPVPS